MRNVNQTLAELNLEKHPDKTYIGKIEKGFDFLGYRFEPRGLGLALGTVVAQAFQPVANKVKRRTYTMAKFSITMPDEMGNYIQSAMKTRQFENTSEYFRHLVRQDQERESKIVELRNMLDKAEASGISEHTAEDIWKEAEQRHLKRSG